MALLIVAMIFVKGGKRGKEQELVFPRSRFDAAPSMLRRPPPAADHHDDDFTQIYYGVNYPEEWRGDR
jgi:hypothetical protein